MWHILIVLQRVASQLIAPRPRHLSLGLVVLSGAFFLLFVGQGASGAAGQMDQSPALPAQVSAAQAYVDALVSGHRVAVGQLDFACQYEMVTKSATPIKAFPPETDPVYQSCWDRIERAHTVAIEQRDQGMDAIWPSKGRLVFYGELLERYAPSFFVMDRLGKVAHAGGFHVATLGTKPLPVASFRLRPAKPVVAAPATLVQLRISYKDPVTAPVSYAPGTYRWANPVQRPRRVLKAVTLNWVVISDLKRLGFPADIAVLNLPVPRDPSSASVQIPFVTHSGGYEKKSGDWWGPTDSSDALRKTVKRAGQIPDFYERIALLNRVLIIDPSQSDALHLLTQDLYQMLLGVGDNGNRPTINNQTLALRSNELYLNTYAQTERMDISLGMEMGGFSEPTRADYMYRMIPAMERLARLKPDDLENRVRLGRAYRWVNDQLIAIDTHEALLRQITPGQKELRARVLIELAWSRIAKVAWNRTLEDPGIVTAYKEAEEAFELTDQPLDKFTAAYTMGYSLIFTPNRDNRAMLEHFTEARRWYNQVDGASPDAWQHLLGNETVKAVIDANPSFQSLLAQS